MANFVRRRGGIYHFRRVIPIALVSVFGKAELVRSLETGNLAVAKRRSRRFASVTDSLFEIAMSKNPAPTRLELERLAQRWFAQTLERIETDFADEDAMDEDRPEEWASNRFGLHAVFADQLRRNDLSGALGLAGSVLAEGGYPDDGMSAKALARLLLRGLVQVSRIAGARTTGDYSAVSDDPMFAPDALAMLDDLTAAPQPPKEPTRQASPLFSELLERYREYTTVERGLTAQTRKLEETSFRNFVEVCGNRPVGDYSKTDLGRYRDTLSALPADWGKAQRWRGMALADIARMSRDEDVARMTVPSVRRHFGALKQVFHYAVERGLIKDDPTDGFKFKDRRPAKSKMRNPWTADELTSLFRSPIWSGCSSNARRSETGKLIIWDGLYWVPLLAVYTGARAGELCQLCREDILEVDGVAAIRISDDGDRQLKNQFSVRTVPIHSQLIKLGFMDFVRMRAPAATDPLFPELPKGGVDKKRSFSFSKRFNAYLDRTGFKASGKDFHAFRHSVQTQLASHNVTDALKNRVMGRAGQGSGDRLYTHGEEIPIATVRDTIELLNWSGVEGATATPLPSKPVLAAVKPPKIKLKPPSTRAG